MTADMPGPNAALAMAVSIAVLLSCTKPDAPAPEAASSAPATPEASSELRPSSNALRQLLEIATRESSTIESFTQAFGPAHKSTVHSDAHEISAPFDEVDRVILGRRLNQNRELLDDTTVVFRAESRPTVQTVADRLGIPLSDPLRVENSCFDTPCPSVTLVYPIQGAGRGLRIRLYVEQPSQASSGNQRNGEGNADARGLGVRKLYFSILETVCPIGKAIEPPTPLPAPKQEVEKRLAMALLEGARELSRDVYDMAALETALHIDLPRVPKCCPRQEVTIKRGPFERAIGSSFRVIFEENSISKFTWVHYFARDNKVVPFDLPGLTYVADPKILCRIGGSGTHLWELRSQGKFRTFVKVSTAEDLLSKQIYVRSISLERSPADWPSRVF